ncbi:hypothetical protein [Stutzerimonas stutzeri]|uniref:hypothetical protein n=1 Tax=Stutzerimonas stutzeri TaxID=316 RepID=UPI0024470E21|nr:hypothetical protein [Stutzerimonas stutzeri]MDH1587981.1 hypothetical protein [Stutzerimonas stutzeri]
MRERPILFNSAMVRAILDGSKTVTRLAVIKSSQPETIFPSDFSATEAMVELNSTRFGTTWWKSCPYGKPGDRLWVRETWSGVNMCGAPALAYRADGDIRDLMAEELFLDEDGAFNYVDQRWKKYDFSCWYADLHQARWRPSIHMPRWASRIMLEITNVRVERLQDITEVQAKAEGVLSCENDIDPDGNYYSPYELFSALWVSINGHESWHANPWVWVVEFKRVEVRHA